MRNFIKILSLLLVAAMLAGCSKIPDFVDSDTSDISDSDGIISEKPAYIEGGLQNFDIMKQDFIARLNAENAVTDGAVVTPETGEGYVKLRKDNELTQIVSVNTSQHYRVLLYARSSEGAVIKLTVAEQFCDVFYVPARTPTEGETELSFDYYAVDCLYLPAGQNILKFNVTDGSADIDYIVVESSDKVSGERYTVASACMNMQSSLYAVNVKRFFSEIYGSEVLTAQNVSPASNAEIEAVYKATGRYPAVRASEIGYALLDDDKNKALAEEEAKLASEWSGRGGILSFTWHWYSPNYTRGLDLLSFNFDNAFENQRPEEVALMTDPEIEALVSNGYMTQELKSLLKDIDTMAQFLAQFEDDRTAILFHPLPDGDAGLYWYGKDNENYKILYRIVFDRLCKYHKLRSLIFVWDGSDMNYYPGDDYVDVIGQSFVEDTNSSFAGRFSSIASLTPSNKILAVSRCDVMPNLDAMFRDNSLWLWCAPMEGEFTLNISGALSESYNSVGTMKNFYNNKFTFALDELPDFSKII